VLRRLRRFGQGLGKGELRLECASGQVALVRELACVGRPFITFDGRAGTPAPFAAHLFVEDGTAQFHLDLADFIGLRGRHRSQQALGRVEGSISVIAGKGLLVRPAIADVA